MGKGNGSQTLVLHLLYISLETKKNIELKIWNLNKVWNPEENLNLNLWWNSFGKLHLGKKGDNFVLRVETPYKFKSSDNLTFEL
jgi:hypothetical protein